MIALNFANMMGEVIGPKGLPARVIEGRRGKVSEIHRQISERTRREFEFLDLPHRDVSGVKAIAEDIRGGSDYFVLLGIGGSALGPRAILEAMSPFHNLKENPKVFIYDNVDPKTLEGILSMVDLARTTVNVISKSGSTAETAASFMILWDRLRAVLGDDAAGRVVATTDPATGTLRKIAAETGMRTLPIAPGVGGRFSVLSPVGLLLAEVIGVDSAMMLRGAGDISELCSTGDVWRNPAFLFGTLLHLMNSQEERDINVMIPYSDRLKFFSEWFCQLWAESLGKNGLGMTPYPSVGTTDQHSQLQLWMEGPEDKIVVFIRVDDPGADFAIPAVFGECEGMQYLAGRRLSELMSAEQESTELALAKRGRPNMTISIPKLDAYHLGQLFHFFEIATAFTGLMMDINPFNQPGVEEGKNYTYGMMGKKGFEDGKAEVEEARQKKTCWTV